MILFPRRNGKQKKGDASKEEVKAARGGENILRDLAATDKFAISNKHEIEEGALGDYEASEDAYRQLRLARSEARLLGKREKRAKQKAEEAEASKK